MSKITRRTFVTAAMAAMAGMAGAQLAFAATAPTGSSQAPDAAQADEELPYGTLDTDEIKALIAQAEQIAGDDEFLKMTQLQQCKLVSEQDNPNLDDLIEPIRLFDNLYFFGTNNVGVFVFTTPEGYIMIDSGLNHFPAEVILPGMESLGLDPAQVKYILVSHAGPDHIGGAYYFQQTFGTKVVMSEPEYARTPEPEENAARLEAMGAPDYKYNPYNLNGLPWPDKDIVGEDGDVVRLGDFGVTMVRCPRVVDGGGLSFIAPVYDNGEEHMWATYGNTNIIGGLADLEVYHQSVSHFLDYVQEMDVDVIISNHPFVDGSADRMAELRGRAEGDPNPFVIGNDKVSAFIELLDQCRAVIAARLEAGLNEYGNAYVEPGYSISAVPKGK